MKHLNVRDDDVRSSRLSHHLLRKNRSQVLRRVGRLFFRPRCWLRILGSVHHTTYYNGWVAAKLRFARQTNTDIIPVQGCLASKNERIASPMRELARPSP